MREISTPNQILCVHVTKCYSPWAKKYVSLSHSRHDENDFSISLFRDQLKLNILLPYYLLLYLLKQSLPDCRSQQRVEHIDGQAHRISFFAAQELSVRARNQISFK